MKFRQWPKRDPNKNYFLVPNEVFHIGLSHPEISIYCYLLSIEDMVIGIIADAMEIDRDDLKRRRAESARNVKATNGLISLEKRARAAEEPNWDGDQWQD